jgi:hypothetical protein
MKNGGQKSRVTVLLRIKTTRTVSGVYILIQKRYLLYIFNLCFFPPLFLLDLGSGMRKKSGSRIRDKYPGSATLYFTLYFLFLFLFLFPPFFFFSPFFLFFPLSSFFSYIPPWGGIFFKIQTFGLYLLLYNAMQKKSPGKSLQNKQFHEKNCFLTFMKTCDLVYS